MSVDAPVRARFQRETMAAVHADIEPLLAEHWEEIAADRDKVPLDPDWDAYYASEKAGILVITTARLAGALVGYAPVFVARNLHYRSLIIGEGDIFWLHPDHRGAGMGLGLLRAAERHCRAAGANKMIWKEKCDHRLGRFFEHLGYKPFEVHYTKLMMD
jgi:GNAT superfamily N-acetyltransferase